MQFHHILSIFIQSMMWYFNEGLEHYRLFAWTELGASLHKLSRLLPSFHQQTWKRYYQLVYLVCYVITYGPIIVYIVSLDGVYDIKQLFGLSTRVIHFIIMPMLVCLLSFWLYESLQAVRYVWIQMEKENNIIKKTN